MASYRSSIPRDEARTHCREEASTMSNRLILVLGTVTLFLVAACSGGGSAGTVAPTAAASAPAESAAAGGSPAAGGGGCTPSTATGTVTVKIANFAFDPATITAKVGDTVTFTNEDSTGHTATSDSDAACTTDTLQNGASGGLTFSAAGSYPFHCKIHPNMKGTITVS
jgi:plastocyanin